MRQDLHASVMFDDRKSKEKTPLASPTHGINANTQLNEQIRTPGSKISIRDLLKNANDGNGDLISGKRIPRNSSTQAFCQMLGCHIERKIS